MDKFTILIVLICTVCVSCKARKEPASKSQSLEQQVYHPTYDSFILGLKYSGIPGEHYLTLCPVQDRKILENKCKFPILKADGEPVTYNYKSIYGTKEFLKLQWEGLDIPEHFKKLIFNIFEIANFEKRTPLENPISLKILLEYLTKVLKMKINEDSQLQSWLKYTQSTPSILKSEIRNFGIKFRDLCFAVCRALPNREACRSTCINLFVLIYQYPTAFSNRTTAPFDICQLFNTYENKDRFPALKDLCSEPKL